MKLLGKDISPAKVMALVTERLAARGLTTQDTEFHEAGVEPRVEPLSFNLHALEENADATRGLPLETHRDGLGGRAVVMAKRVFRQVGQIFINEALGRQTVFNGHVRDSYAQLSAEVVRLRARIAELERKPAPATSDAVMRENVEALAESVAQLPLPSPAVSKGGKPSSVVSPRRATKPVAAPSKPKTGPTRPAKATKPAPAKSLHRTTRRGK